MAAVEPSKPVKSGTLATNVITQLPSASQRASTAWRSPSNSITTPVAIGSQISRLSSPIPCGIPFLSLSQQPPRQQRGEADDHCERIVIQVSRLHVAHD